MVDEHEFKVIVPERGNTRTFVIEQPREPRMPRPEPVPTTPEMAPSEQPPVTEE